MNVSVVCGGDVFNLNDCDSFKNYMYSVDGVKVWDVSVRHLYDDLRFDQHCSSGYASLTEDELIGCLKKIDVTVSEHN